MECSVDVFVGNSTIVDSEIYQLWVDGNSAREAADILQQRGILQQCCANMDLLMSDVLDHYRTFHMLERLLHTPLKLTEEWTFQMELNTQKMLIEKYYELDDSVLREILGKKLSSRHRKDLDEVSEKTSVSLISCRRQFDNVRRIHKAVEEMQGHIINNIQNNFLLSAELSKKYAAVVFVACNRFETNKRKLQYLTFSDFYHCAHSMMELWSAISQHGHSQFENEMEIETDLDVDRGFLTDLRDVRLLLDKEKEHKHLVCSQLKGRLTDKIYADVESSFKTHSRSLVAMAGSLNRSRELRSFFVDLVERCVEPLKQARWTSRDLRVFLDYYTPAGVQLLKRFKSDSATAVVWERYMKVIGSCLVKIYHN